MPEEVQPAKRGPGRPRKTPVAEEVVEAVEGERALWIDDRAGLRVDNPAWVGITFEDNREYRVENGVIVERIR